MLAWAVADLFGCVKWYISSDTAPIRVNGVAQVGKDGEAKRGRRVHRRQVTRSSGQLRPERKAPAAAGQWGGPLMVAQKQNGNGRLAALSDDDVSEVEVIDGHITRRRITRTWPRTDWDWDYPKSVRPVVETDDKIRVPVHVTLKARDGYIYSCGHQDHICRGEDVEAGGEFLRKHELKAERMALEGL